MSSINVTLSDIFRTTSVGDPRTAVASALYGINHRLTPGAVPINRDYHGLILFSRPQLNLTDVNVRALRQLVPLLTTADTSIQRMVRKLLDPRLTSLNCPLIDNKNAFIPMLSNMALSASGFPDLTLQSRISKPGLKKEVYGQIDDVVDVLGNNDISVSFRNMVGDPITYLFQVWLTYMSAVFEGTMIPYPDFIAHNVYDYNTRIWRLILDKNKRYVTKIGATGYGYPRSVPLGAAFDFSSDRPLNNNNDTINIQFQSFGVTYNDIILVHEFNKLVGIFNPDMLESNSTGKPVGAGSSLVQVDYSDLGYFNNRGYLRIDPSTMELQVWVSVDEFNAVATAINRTVTALNAG